jgi:hypothetical protein
MTSDAEMLALLQHESFGYFGEEVAHTTGLVLDRTEPGAPSSIAAVGLALSCYPIAVEHGWWSRPRAIARTLVTLRQFRDTKHGHNGFFFHFLEPTTGERAGGCELSSIDTALLVAGALTAACYFDGPSGDEREIRTLADQLYRRVEWTWMATPGGILRHGWTPEHGFLPYAWDRGYSEAHIAYVLALGSPTHPIDPAGYRAWTTTFERKTCYGLDYVYAGPLFIHQLSQIWLDLHGIRDDHMREVGFDYFENSRRATLVQRGYATDNPHGFAHYSADSWGFTASDGPGPWQGDVAGIHREFLGYAARGAPDGPDDGTLSPWAVVASLPFAPEIVCRAIRHAIDHLSLKGLRGPGFAASFNPTFPRRTDHPLGWISPWRFALNQGPIVLMIENHTTGFVWDLVRSCPYIASGLAAAGFRLFER